VTALGRPPDRAREGHGQHLGIPRLKSNLDDRDAGYLDLQHCGAVKPLVTIGRANALMVSKSVRDLLSAAAPSWTFSMSVVCVIQDHPAHIP
jgi:hypothetical protein